MGLKEDPMMVLKYSGTLILYNFLGASTSADRLAV